MNVMVSGHFDPFTFAHLDYLKKAAKLGDYVVCLISSDKQLILKKGWFNEPASERAEILHLVLKGLRIPHEVVQNVWDKDTTLVAEALKALKPDIFCRGTDKREDDTPDAEKAVCDKLGVKIVKVEGKIVHGSDFS